MTCKAAMKMSLKLAAPAGEAIKLKFDFAFASVVK